MKFLVLKSLGLRYGVLSLRYDTAQITCSQIAPKSSPIQSIADNSSTVYLFKLSIGMYYFVCVLNDYISKFYLNMTNNEKNTLNWMRVAKDFWGFNFELTIILIYFNKN